MTINKKITEKAKAAGFDQVGYVRASDVPEALGDRLSEFLENGWHGDMDWLEEKADRRRHPKLLWPKVKGIIMLGFNYGPEGDALENLPNKSVGNISVYARGRDYHDLVKKRLKQIGRWVHSEFEVPIKVFVDTAPVMEKPLAQLAGLGWQGKHTNLVSTELGSWLFLGAIFTTLELEPSSGEEDHCGSCRACLDICPTNAFPSPYKLDARRCISYLTIEHKGPIPKEFRKPIGNRIYGCDDCLAVCPWNKYAQVANELSYFTKEHLKAPPLDELLQLDEARFREFFQGSPIKRTGRDRFIRNTLIAAGNSGEEKYLTKITNLLEDPSDIVRGAAAWALQEIGKTDQIEKARAKGLKDASPVVRAERQ